MGYLPSRDQICLFSMEGKIETEALPACMDTLTAMIVKTFAVTRLHVADKLRELEEPEPNSNSN
jgi:hypothetical protein